MSRQGKKFIGGFVTPDFFNKWKKYLDELNESRENVSTIKSQDEIYLALKDRLDKHYGGTK